MKIPDKVRIGGVDYAIKYVQNLNNGENLMCGRISYDGSLIEISENVQPSAQAKCLTLWHEIVHAIFAHFDSPLRKDENVVDMLARGIYMVLEDNIENLYELETPRGPTEECNERRCFEQAP